MHPDNRRKTGYSNIICEHCFRTKTRKRHKLDKQRYRKDPLKNKALNKVYRVWFLRKMYKITPKEFDELFKEQGYKCASCGSLDSRWAKGWCIDHNHSCCKTTPTCGKCIRGILCMPCNMAAGVMKDNIQDLQSLVKYLEIKKGPAYSKPDIKSIL